MFAHYFMSSNANITLLWASFEDSVNMWATIQLVLKFICIHYILENLDTCSSHRNDLNERM